MARPPRFKDLTIDVPEDAEWFRTALPQLSSFMNDTTYALEKALIPADNFSRQKKVLELTAADIPLTFDCTLPRSPERVVLLQKRALDTGGSFSGPTDVSNWTYENGRITLNSVTGLNSNTRYQLTIEVV
jgi:hypothetical protein